SYVYVANETGVAVVPALIAPQISLLRLSMSLSGTTLTVAGAPSAVSGSAPISIEIADAASLATATATAQSDGSFIVSLTAAAGDAMTIKATDTFGHSNGPLSIGTVPFGAKATTVLIGAPP